MAEASFISANNALKHDIQPHFGQHHYNGFDRRHSSQLQQLPFSAVLLPVPVDPSQLYPEEAVQYYRASTIVLAMSGYNDSGTFSNYDNTTDTPLPANTDTTLLDCLNQTIGAAAPLVSGAIGVPWTAPAPVVMVGFVWLGVTFCIFRSSQPRDTVFSS
jgi:hypothetical protein